MFVLVSVQFSAGVGRTGTFIMLDIMLQRMVIESQVEVRHTVQLLRKERGYMVQSLVRSQSSVTEKPVIRTTSGVEENIPITA